MDQTIRNTLRETVLAVRSLLENSIGEELQGWQGICTANTKGRGTPKLVVEDDERMGHLEADEIVLAGCIGNARLWPGLSLGQGLKSIGLECPLFY